MEDMGKLLELRDGEHYMAVWPPFPSEIKRKLENLLEKDGYTWQGGGTACDYSECHFYFKKRLKLKWRQYIPVVAAGFSCGMGLITTVGVGITFLSKSVIKLPF